MFWLNGCFNQVVQRICNGHMRCSAPENVTATDVLVRGRIRLFVADPMRLLLTSLKSKKSESFLLGKNLLKELPDK